MFLPEPPIELMSFLDEISVHVERITKKDQSMYTRCTAALNLYSIFRGRILNKTTEQFDGVVSSYMRWSLNRLGVKGAKYGVFQAGSELRLSATSKCRDLIKNQVTKDFESQGKLVCLDFRNHFDIVSRRTANLDHVADIVSEMKLALQANIARTVCLLGPAGTGKTTLAQTIMGELKLRTLSVSSNYFNHNGYTQFCAFVKFAGITGVIIDDFEKEMFSARHLSGLEYLQEHIPLVILTANCLDDLDPATIRPGRIDRVIRILKPPQEAVLALTKDLPELTDFVQDWPVAYIQELRKRCHYMGKERALSTVQELLDRARGNDKKSGNCYNEPLSIDDAVEVDPESFALNGEEYTVVNSPSI